MIVGILDFLITPYSDLVFWTEEKIQEWWKKLQVLDIYLIDIYLIFLFDIVKKFKRLIGNSIFKSINWKTIRETNSDGRPYFLVVLIQGLPFFGSHITYSGWSS